MQNIYKGNEWIEEQVMGLTTDKIIMAVYHDFLTRTVGEASQDIKFVYDAYYTKDGIGRPEKIETIGTWLCVERRVNSDFVNDGVVDDLLKYGELDAVWKYAHERLASLNYDGIIPEQASDEEMLVEFEDGYKIVGLNTPEALRNEHKKSGLVGYYSEGYDNWVLRNNDGKSVVIMTLQGQTIVKIKGPNRSAVPAAISAAYLINEICERDLKLDKPSIIDGYVQTSDGKLHDIRDLPKGSVIDGDFGLFESSGSISSLPDDLTVNGNLFVHYGPYFTKTPRNLTVNGNLGIAADGVPLRVIGSGLKVERQTFLGFTENLQRIEKDVDFGEELVLSAKAIQLKAEPFNAERIDVIGGRVEQSNVPRNKDGQVVIDGEYLKSSEKAKLGHEFKQIPGLIASVLYDSVKISIRNKIRSLKKKQTKKSETDNDGPPSPKM